MRFQNGFTALFNNMRTLKFKAQPTNAFFTSVNQLFGGSSQLPTMLSKRFDLITARSVVVGNWEEPPNIWLTVAKNAFVGWALNFRVRMLLKSAVTSCRAILVWNHTCDFKSNSRCALVRFWNHAYDFRPNCTPLSSITIINRRAESQLPSRTLL